MPTIREKIISFAETHPSFTSAEVIAEFGLNRANATTRLRIMSEAGDLVREATFERGCTYTYRRPT